MLVDQKNLPDTDWSDTFWIGGTVTAKVATVDLWGSVVYGQRRQPGAVAGTAFDQSGWGAVATARVPVGPLSVFAAGWYTSGDGTQPVGGGGGRATLTGDSDTLPLPLAASSWFGGGGDYIAEWIFGNASIGAPGIGQPNYADPAGTYGIGGSVSYALTPAVSFGGGVAYVGASDQGSTAWGDSAFTLDAGINYRFNPNLSIQGRAGYVLPDTGDNAWGLAFRTQFSF
jgi:predicted porin